MIDFTLDDMMGTPASDDDVRAALGVETDAKLRIRIVAAGADPAEVETASGGALEEIAARHGISRGSP